ncbi:MAG: acetyltransferase [Methanoregulaceae archaeon]|jgi:pimeloyl-ACP methyl ester carboxylesterase|nr:acetyltransferase [Methanoregulaceae archaeon]MCU0627864.1 acetyltransferase [Methanoregulaceae archaeon]
MEIRDCPVILVHGWKSHPGIWKRFLPLLADTSLPVWNFGYDGLNGASLADLAAALQQFICEKQDETGYEGPIDIVGHCMGTCVARYMLEVIDGEVQSMDVRQLIGLGPPNNGSSIAELFCDPIHGSGKIRELSGSFFPHGCNPVTDTIVQEFRPGSRRMRILASAGLRQDITYRIILTGNPGRDPRFFPAFDGMTWEYSRENGWKRTYLGDGIVPHTDSFIEGVGLDILPVSGNGFVHDPTLYCHFNLPKNPEIMQRVMEYLSDPATHPHSVCPNHNTLRMETPE